MAAAGHYRLVAEGSLCGGQATQANLFAVAGNLPLANGTGFARCSMHAATWLTCRSPFEGRNKDIRAERDAATAT
jgi:hypothetical protein